MVMSMGVKAKVRMPMERDKLLFEIVIYRSLSNLGS